MRVAGALFSRAIDRGDRGFLVLAALLFVASAGITIAWTRAMSAMTAMSITTAMPAMDAIPPRDDSARFIQDTLNAPTRGWLGAGVNFVVMWTVMMVAMMLPSLVPALWRYRLRLSRSVCHRAGIERDTLFVTLGYFGVWIAAGMGTYAFGALITGLGHPFTLGAPYVARVVLFVAGVFQFTPSKRRQLSCCRSVLQRDYSANPFRLGAQYGLQCTRCCAGPMAVLLALGMMDLRVMTAVTIAITAERASANAVTAARVAGAASVLSGVLWIARALGHG